MTPRGSIAATRNVGIGTVIRDRRTIQNMCLSVADIEPGQDAIMPGVKAPVKERGDTTGLLTISRQAESLTLSPYITNFYKKGV